jgi:hypothetical protein
MAQELRADLEQKGYAYVGPSALNAIKGTQFEKNLYRSGTNYFLTPGTKLPSNLASLLPKTTAVLPKPSDPLAVDSLGGGTFDFGQILGSNVPNVTVNSDIAGLLSLYGRGSKEQEGVDALQGQLTETMKQLGNQGTDLQAELEKQGVTQGYKQAQELNLKAAQLKGSLESFDAETEKLKGQIEEQPIASGLLAGQTAQLQKQRDLTRLSKAAELSSTIALSQAYQGNAQLGSELAKNAIDMKYQPILAQISVLEKQLGFANEKLSSADQKRSNIITELLSIKKQEIADQKAKDNQLESIAIEAASNGAPMNVIQSIKMADNAVDAAKAASQYLTANVQRKQTLADQDKAFQREKELIKYRESFQGSPSLTLTQMSADPLLAFTAAGGRRVQKSDGGFDFFSPDGQKITVEQAVNMTGLGSKADFLKGSGSQSDIQAIQAGQGKQLSATAKSQQANANLALQNISTLQSLLNKGIGAGTIFKAKLPYGLGSKDAQEFQTAAKSVTDLLARMRTGAVINAEELKLYKSFIPGVGDKKEIRQQKLNNLKYVFEQLAGGASSANIADDIPGLDAFISQ